MDKQQLQKLLQKKYSRDEWNSLLSDIFPSVNLLKEPERIEVNNKNVKSFHQTGLVRLKDGKNLAVFEVILDDGINLLRNRVALRNLTTRYIDEANNHGVLVVYDQGKENYRFTFVSQESGFNEKGEWATFETASKRFTYILGEGESCRTASERLALLASKKTSAKLDDVIDAFSVEQLSKEFFTKYKAHYQAFVDYLVGSNFKKSMFSGDDKAIRDFVKKMLGRIVFLYFLQKKGWLGASDESYSDGDKNFMQTFWESSGKADTFYSQHLTRLFFQGLNATDREKEFFEMADGKKVKIPYLNGGLFDKDRNEPELLTFPSNLFNSLFSFFAEYNFTIDENDPEEHEVGIDPEMLGHIFENLLEDNKDKGAYYTPKEIVQYMTQESLIEYLKTGLEKKNQVLSDDEGNALKYFVRYKLKGDEIPKEDLKVDVARFYQNQLRFIQTYGSQVNRLLDDVKICDPAIGSGAFPMGLLNEIYHCKLILNNTYSLEERAKVKRHIIENSIYGVDIEKGAVDIARLRFWLSLIVDEEKPSPLPNLDYKIVPGDSLVSRFEDEVIDIDWNVKYNTGGLFEQDLFDVKTKLLTAISEKQKKYFEPSQINKEKLNLEIRNLKLDILINQLRLMIAQKGGNDSYNGAKKSKKQLEAELLIEGWKRTLAKLVTLKLKPEEPFNHFDWKLDFPEILNPILSEKKCGFDIVIGNPPYLRVQGLREKHSHVIQYFIKNYVSATGRFDLYTLFTEKSFSILNNNGILNFIQPDKWINSDFGKGLRNHIKNHVFKLISFGQHQVFNVSTYTSLIWITKTKTHFTKYLQLEKTLDSEEKLSKFLFSIQPENFSEINNNIFGEAPWILLNKKDNQLINNLIKSKVCVKDIFLSISQGIVSVGDDIFILQGNFQNNYFVAYSNRLDKNIFIEKNIVKPLLKGEDVKKYASLTPNHYVIYPHHVKDGKTIPYDESEMKLKFPNTYEYFLNFKEELIDKKIRYKTNPSYWYSLHRSRELSIFETPKIITPEISLGTNMSIDYDNLLHNTKCYSFILNPEFDRIGLIPYLAILNSTVHWYYLKNTGYVLRGGFFTFKTKYIENFPLPELNLQQSKSLKTIAEYVLAITKNHTIKYDEFVPNSHIIKTFEELIDAMVMELYFNSDFEREGIEFIKYVERDFKPINDLPENKKIEIIREAYQKLREKENEIRNNLKLMDTRLSEIVMPIKSII